MKAASTGIFLLGAQALLGLGSYVMLLAAGRCLDATQFAAFAVFWSVAFSLGLGLFGPLELLLYRLASLRTTAADSVEIPRLTKWYLWIGATAAAAAGAFLAWTAGSSLVTGWVLAATAIAYFFVLRILAIQRGESAGRGQYNRYARQVGVDGATRILVSAPLFVLGRDSAAPWALGLVVAGLAGAFAARRPADWDARATDDAPTASPASRTLRDVLILSGGTTLSIILANSLPSIAALLGAHGQELATFSALVLVARVPLFFAGLGTAVIVPRVSATTGSPTRLQAETRRLLSLSAVAATGAFLALGLLVAPLAKVVFPSAGAIPPAMVWSLAFSTGALLLAQLGQGIPVGAGHMGYVAYIWTSAAAVFTVALLVIGGETTSRVAYASALSAAAACVALTHSLTLLLRRHQPTVLSPGIG